MNNASKKINTKVMVIMMTCMGGTFTEVLLDKDGYRGPHHVFRTLNFGDIVKVENELVEI